MNEFEKFPQKNQQQPERTLYDDLSFELKEANAHDAVRIRDEIIQKIGVQEYARMVAERSELIKRNAKKEGIDPDDVFLYHVFKQSSPESGGTLEPKYFDFSGADSIETIYRVWQREISEKEKENK